MYSYKYTLEVSSWSDNAKEYITNLIQKYSVIYDIEQSLKNSNEIILTIKGEKDELDKLEFKLIKNLSNHTDIEDFVKTTTEITDDMLLDNSFLDIEGCEFSLIYKDKTYQNPLEESIKLLKSQKVGLIKNINGHYICAIATKSAPLKKIRDILQMPTQSFPLLVKSTFQASKFVALSKKEEELLTSEIRPIIKTKKKSLHRLEKVKNIPINAVAPTNIYFIKLPKNPIEETIAQEINLPLIFQIVHDYKEISKKVDFILTFEKNFLEYEDSLMQTIYGKSQIIKLGYGFESFKIDLPKTFDKNCVCKTENSLAIGHKNQIKLAPCCIDENEYYILNDFEPKVILENISPNSIAIAHRYKSGFDEALIFEFSTNNAQILLYKDKKFSNIASFEKSPKEYFDECALKAGLLKKINYENESQLVCDNSYEICFEKSYEYTFKNKVIMINLQKELNKNEIGSALLNCFTNIVKDFYQNYQLPIILCGDVFENKNLTENIIEFFDENNITYHISSNIPLNQTSVPLGTLLDIINKK